MLAPSTASLQETGPASRAVAAGHEGDHGQGAQTVLLPELAVELTTLGASLLQSFGKSRAGCPG